MNLRWACRGPSTTVSRGRATAALLTVALTVGVARGGDRPVPGKLDEAVDRGLAYLARQQRPDGAFDHQRQPDGQDANAAASRRAITGLCALAFLSAGQTQDAGRHAGVVRRAVDALVEAVPADGFVGGKDDRPMYAQAVVTLALATAHGAEPSADRRAKQRAALGRLVAVILAAQAVPKDPAFAGGWRLARDAADSDVPLTCWNAVALRAAADVGVPVPPDRLRAAADFVARCQPPGHRGFLPQPAKPAPAGGHAPAAAAATPTGATAAGVLALYLLDATPRPGVREAAGSLAGRPLDGRAFDGRPVEGQFWVVQAASVAGDDAWAAAARPVLDRVLAARDADGGWPRNWPGDSNEPGRVYRTALATLTLTTAYRFLPAFQR